MFISSSWSSFSRWSTYALNMLKFQIFKALKRSYILSHKFCSQSAQAKAMKKLLWKAWYSIATSKNSNRNSKANHESTPHNRYFSVSGQVINNQLLEVSGNESYRTDLSEVYVCINARLRSPVLDHLLPRAREERNDFGSASIALGFQPVGRANWAWSLLWHFLWNRRWLLKRVAGNKQFAS